jgi:hypothetical protein
MTIDRAVPIIIENAVLDEKSGRMVVHGLVTKDSLRHLKVDDYQRGVLAASQRVSIMQALQKGEPLPELEFGMRSEKMADVDKTTTKLKDHVYIIDGLQRRDTVLEFLQAKPDAEVRIGAVVWLNTTKEWERERFHILNAKRLKVSPNVLLRNRREASTAVATLWGLTKNERTFVMHNRVCWEQNVARGELITAMTFARAANFLHSHKGPIAGANVEGYVESLDKISEIVGVQAMRENLRTFWGLVDECWGIQRVHQRGSAPYLKGNFLDVFAKILSDHYEFWQGDDERKLFVHAPLRRKLAQFSINDTEVVRLAGAGGKAREILYILMRDHINSGKRTKRLSSRVGDAVILKEATDDANETAEVA